MPGFLPANLSIVILLIDGSDFLDVVAVLCNFPKFLERTSAEQNFTSIAVDGNREVSSTSARCETTLACLRRKVFLAFQSSSCKYTGALFCDSSCVWDNLL